MLEKSSDEKAIVDIGNGADEHEDSWAVLLDKGYTGVDGEIRAILPKKKPRGGILSASDKRQNENQASDRIVVDFLGGRALFGVLWQISTGGLRVRMILFFD